MSAQLRLSFAAPRPIRPGSANPADLFISPSLRSDSVNPCPYSYPELERKLLELIDRSKEPGIRPRRRRKLQSVLEILEELEERDHHKQLLEICA